MRTLLLLPLVLIPVVFTVASLFILQRQMQRQMHEALAADLRHSAATYRNIEADRRMALAREATLLAFQPSLKALMTTQDARTIQDEGGEYARLSGTDLLALLSPAGAPVAVYDRAREGGQVSRGPSAKLAGMLRNRTDGAYLFDGERLFETGTEPMYFGSNASGSLLGYVVIGSVVDREVAQQVSQTASAEIVFAVGPRVVSSTLDEQGRAALSQLLQGPVPPVQAPQTLAFGGRRYLMDEMVLAKDGGEPIALIVLRSMEDLLATQQRLNRLVLGLGMAALLAGGMLAFVIARSLTSPLEGLARAVAAVGGGDFAVELPVSGAAEIRRLSASIETMRGQIRDTQGRLLEAERLATIGQMARSVSHDLRHYLASVYANAEFLAGTQLTEAERLELLAEIRLSVQGTTDLIESLLLFSQTGRALHVSYESVTYLAERAIMLVSKHPEAADVGISLVAESTGEAWVDGRKIERAIYNLVLNGCQAAKRNEVPAKVTVQVSEEHDSIQIRVTDSGAGVPPSIRDSLFEPFVSANKENGIGIGLTLATTIAQEHGGSVRLDSGANGMTAFVVLLDREAARAPTMPAAQEAEEAKRRMLQGSPVPENAIFKDPGQGTLL